jgi:hypothetical protein
LALKGPIHRADEHNDRHRCRGFGCKRNTRLSHQILVAMRRSASLAAIAALQEKTARKHEFHDVLASAALKKPRNIAP